MRIDTNINKNSPLPLYKQVEKRLRESIRNIGGDSEDAPIPAERDLAKAFNIQRLTVRRAIEQLVREGLLYKIRGKGTFIKKTTVISNKVIDVVFSRDAIKKEINPLSWFVVYEIFRGVTAGADAHGIHVHLLDLEWRRDFEEVFFNAYDPRGSAGVIFAEYSGHEATVEKLRQMGIPYVIANGLKKDKSINNVYTDIEESVCDAVQHLIERGHTRIGMLNGPMRSPWFQDRYNGYAKAHYLRYMPLDHELVVECEGEAESGYVAMKQLLGKRKEMTAVLAATDLRAFGAMKAINEAGMSVPDDMSVIGYDDIEDAESHTPPLTTVRHPRFELGIEAVNLLVDLACGKVIAPTQRMVPGALVARGTTTRIAQGVRMDFEGAAVAIDK